MASARWFDVGKRIEAFDALSIGASRTRGCDRISAPC
jgi:hypothetical protein